MKAIVGDSCITCRRPAERGGYPSPRWPPSPPRRASTPSRLSAARPIVWTRRENRRPTVERQTVICPSYSDRHPEGRAPLCTCRTHILFLLLASPTTLECKRLGIVFQLISHLLSFAWVHGRRVRALTLALSTCERFMRAYGKMSPRASSS